MLTSCIACTKQPSDEDHSKSNNNYNKQPSMKSLTSQLKDMTLKPPGPNKPCNTCTSSSTQAQHKVGTVSESDKFKRLYKRTTSSRTWGKEMEARLKGISSGEVTPNSVSRRRAEPVVFVEESEPKEWVAQVEPGVLITFVSLPHGGNDLRRIRFSREMFNKWQAQRWWTDNYDKVMELYNVQRLSRQAFPLPTPPRSEDESSKIESAEDIPLTPPLTRERLPHNLCHPKGMAMGNSSVSSSSSLDHHLMHPRQYCESNGLSSTPKLSSISGTMTETSSMDASMRSSSLKEADQSKESSISNASDLESEWVEEDEPGVYITIKQLSNGKRELRRVRFSREKFAEMHARLWWEENRARIHKQYL